MSFEQLDDGTAVNPQLGVPKASWAGPPGRVELATTEVHVWSAFLDLPASELERIKVKLSVDERERAGRFRFPAHAQRFIARRAVLREILGSYVGQEPGSLRFHQGKNGKPTLVWSEQDSAIRFSVSHSGPLGLFAVSWREHMGVDVERIRQLPDIGELACRFFTEREYKEYQSLPVSDRVEGFFTCWTRKEAYLKATGEGLYREPDSFEVSLVPGHRPRMCSIDGDDNAAKRWTLFHLVPSPGFAGALAIQTDRLKLQCWHWTGNTPA